MTRRDEYMATSNKNPCTAVSECHNLRSVEPSSSLIMLRSLKHLTFDLEASPFFLKKSVGDFKMARYGIKPHLLLLLDEGSKGPHEMCGGLVGVGAVWSKV